MKFTCHSRPAAPGKEEIMNEDKDLEKTPVVRPENAPVVKKEAEVPMEKPQAGVPMEKEAAGVPMETAAEVKEASAEEVKEAPAEAPKEEPAAEEALKAEEAAPEAEEPAEEVHVDSPEADVEINIIDDRDETADSLIRWGAGRAGVIVAAPLLGTVALIANEVYMISKIGKVYGVELNQTAVLSFLGSMGATVVGSTLATLIPIAAMQIPIGVSVTYGVGKAAQRWIKDGMPDDTRPYKEVFEEEKANGEKDEKELEANPKKDEPLGDEKKDFTKELKKSWNDIYPERAHNTINQLADQLQDKANIFGDKLVNALKKAGVTDEQIENAKYTILGASEVAQETAQKTAKDLQAIARIKSREFRKDAAERANDMRGRARDQMDVLQKKTDEMKYRTEVQSEQMKLRSEKLKAQARVQMQEAKIQAGKLKIQAYDQAQAAQERAQEITDTTKTKVQEVSDTVKTKTAEYKEAAQQAAAQTKETFRQTAEDYKAKIEERAAQKRAEAEAAGKENAPVEDAANAEGKAEPAAKPSDEAK